MKNSEEKYQIMDLPFTPFESSDSLKKRMIPYTKLVVPIRMRSVYWKYFGFPADEDGCIITKDKIVCILCKNQMINNHNTSNLRMHLTSKHKSVMAKIDPTALIPPPKSSKQKKSKTLGRARGNSELGCSSLMGISKKIVTKEVQVVVSEENNEQDISDIAIIFPNDVSEYNQHKADKEPVESNEITDTIVNFIISDLIAPDVVDGSGFHCLMSNLSSKAVVVPNEKKLVSDIIPTLFNSCKEQLYSSMHTNSINNLSLSMEEWTCVNSIKCISIYVHFTQNSEAALKTRLLRTISYTGSETMGYWTGILDRLFQEWLIDVNFVTAVIVSFNNDGLLKAIQAKNLITVPCFMSVIEKMCNEFCFHHYQIKPILEKCRKLAKYLQDNRIEFQDENLITNETVNHEEDDEGFESNPNPDRQGLWLTTYFMLKSLLHRKNAIEEAVLNLDPELIYVIPTEDEWKIVDDVVSLLEPLRTIVITLFEEKNLLISLLKPLVWKVCSSRFELNDEDSKLIQELKKQIKQTLNSAYGEQEVHNLTQIATLLDPRFKHFIHQEGKMDVEATLIELLTNFVNAEGSSSPRLSATEQEPKKTSRLSGINSLLGNICAHKSTLTIEDRIKAEINQYQSESSAVLEQCPLDWWCHMSNKCPNLSRLAYRYHCIPAVVTHTGHYSLLEYIKFHQKRSVLNVDVADALLFLHSNKNLL
ncbi:hypothetical protein V9T40_011909 [Parthenolecanium corni]|uniref:BED-type domain-containing protein n=1 Tax=Parthenolecanium corni TaxID=536013 RepID=A0AAN9T6B4_9HEMI